MNESRAARKARQQLLTEGKPYQKIIGFTIPILIGSLFQQLYSMADALIISRTLGVEAFAGVSSTGSITFLILGFAQGLTAGLAISISQSFGAGDTQAVKRHYVHNLAISLAVVAALTTLSPDWLLAVVQTPADILGYAKDYLTVIFGGMAVSMLYNFFANTLRALGQTLMPTLAGVMELVMRTVAAFILVPRFEFLGAAVSTPLSWLGAMVPVAAAYIIAAQKLRRKALEE